MRSRHLTETNMNAETNSRQELSLWQAIRIWAQIGVLSFGGPTAQIALMHRVIVDERKWLTEQQFLNALGFCMLLPGPEAMQLATYAGWRLHGVIGGLAAGLLFVIPGALVVLALSMVYAAYGNVPFVEAVFFGIKAAVLVIVVEALLRIAKRALKKFEHWLIAAMSFVAIFFLALPFPVIVFLAAAWGFFRLAVHDDDNDHGQPPIAASFAGTLRTIALWLAIWILPLAALFVIFGSGHVLSELGLFFSKLAVVTFGGAYAVLAYMGQDAVQHYQWLTAGQMMDGLGLAETTPGPLILVTEFVGYMAAYQHGTGAPLAMGLAGAAVALWATFAPCFLWIFTGAPYIDWINAQPRLKGALSAITASVVGVILNLAIWFGLHVFFKDVSLQDLGWVKLWTPDILTLDWRVVALAIVSGYLLLVRHWGIAAVLGVASALALVIKFASI